MTLLDLIKDTLSTINLNASLLERIQDDPLLTVEKEALIKTQESLKARMTFLVDLYAKEKKAPLVKEDMRSLIAKSQPLFPRRFFSPLLKKRVHLRKRRMHTHQPKEKGLPQSAASSSDWRKPL